MINLDLLRTYCSESFREYSASVGIRQLNWQLDIRVIQVRVVKPFILAWYKPVITQRQYQTGVERYEVIFLIHQIYQASSNLL